MLSKRTYYNVLRIKVVVKLRKMIRFYVKTYALVVMINPFFCSEDEKI